MANEKDSGQSPRVVKGMSDVHLSREAFRERFLQRFYDPAFDSAKSETERVLAIAYDAYENYRKSPRTKPAGPGFADPEFPLAVEWLETRRKIAEAEQIHRDEKSGSRILLINGAARSDQTCPGEMSKNLSINATGTRSDRKREVRRVLCTGIRRQAC